MKSQLTGPGQTGVTGTSALGPVHSVGSGTVTTPLHAMEVRTVGRTLLRGETVTQSLVSITYFGTFITFFDRKRKAIKSIDS